MGAPQVAVVHLRGGLHVNRYLDWPLSGWEYGLAPLAYTVISAMASSPYPWSRQDEKNPDCVMRVSNIVGVWYGL